MTASKIMITLCLCGLGTSFSYAETVTRALTSADFSQAASLGRTFTITTQSGACRGGAGGTNPVTTSFWSRSNSPTYPNAQCDHRGLQGAPLANGWKVTSAEIEKLCQILREEIGVRLSWHSVKI